MTQGDKEREVVIELEFLSDVIYGRPLNANLPSEIFDSRKEGLSWSWCANARNCLDADK